MKKLLCHVFGDLSEFFLDLAARLMPPEALPTKQENAAAVLRIKAQIELTKTHPCPRCRGIGTIGKTDPCTCPNCLGTRVNPLFWIAREMNLQTADNRRKT